MQRIVAVVIVLAALLSGIYLGSSSLGPKRPDVVAKTDWVVSASYEAQLEELDELLTTDYWHFKMDIIGLADLAAGHTMAMWPQLVNEQKKISIERKYESGGANIYTVMFTDGTDNRREWAIFELRADGRCMIGTDRRLICESMPLGKRIDRYRAIDARMSSVTAIIAPREQS